MARGRSQVLDSEVGSVMGHQPTSVDSVVVRFWSIPQVWTPFLWAFSPLRTPHLGGRISNLCVVIACDNVDQRAITKARIPCWARLSKGGSVMGRFSGRDGGTRIGSRGSRPKLSRTKRVDLAPESGLSHSQSVILRFCTTFGSALDRLAAKTHKTLAR